MLTRLDLRGAGTDIGDRLPRPDLGGAAPVEAVREILAEVKKRGDAALREYTERFDGVAVDELAIGPAALDEALAATPPLLREALEEARAAILAYHRAQLRDDATHEREGVTVRELARPVDRAGVYVPGGRAPLSFANHFETWHDGAYNRALARFLSESCDLPEVRCVSIRELVDWLDGLPRKALRRYRRGNFPKLPLYHR